MTERRIPMGIGGLPFRGTVIRVPMNEYDELIAVATTSEALLDWGRPGSGSVPIHADHRAAINAWVDAVDAYLARRIPTGDRGLR